MRTIRTAFVGVALLVSLVAAPADSVAQSFTLAAVKVVGATLTTEADAARLSGLTVGKPITIAELQSATDRLAQSGLFTKVQYRYVTGSGQITVTFEVEEAVRDVPVLFDNLVWFSEQELVGAVRQQVPGFAGTAPRNEGAPALLVRTLQGLLSARNLPGEVGVMPQVDTRGNLLGFVFKVENPGPRICAITFPGASPQLQQDLASASSSLQSSTFSRLSLDAIARGTWTGIYRRRGYWAAGFEPLAVRLDSTCGGVVVSVPVKEGSVYAWDKAVWSGNAALAASALDPILGFKTGDLADGARLESALLNVRKAYGKIGFLQANTSVSPQLDDTSRRVIFAITVTEGAQFRMGTLSIEGLSPNDAASLQKRWQLAPGDVFDNTYPDSFVDKEASRYRRQGAPPPAVEFRGNIAAKTVDVVIKFR